MEDLLENLERQIRKLMERHDQLSHSNQQLQQRKNILDMEKNSLLLKQKHAVGQIEALVAKLKTIEK